MTAPFRRKLCPLLGALSLLGTLLSPTAALASATMATFIDNVQLGVLDLTPEDGVAPGFDLGATSAYFSVTLYGAGHDIVLVERPEAGAAVMMPLTYGNLSASMQTSGQLGDLAAQAFGDSDLGARGRLSSGGVQAMELTLHPYSALTLTGHLFAEAARGGTDPDAYSASSLVRASIIALDSTGRYSDISRIAASWGDMPYVTTIDEEFSLSLANDSATAIPISVSFGVQGGVSAYTPPLVPEPGALPMLGAGLLTLALLKLRARRRH